MIEPGEKPSIHQEKTPWQYYNVFILLIANYNNNNNHYALCVSQFQLSTRRSQTGYLLHLLQLCHSILLHPLG